MRANKGVAQTLRKVERAEPSEASEKREENVRAIERIGKKVSRWGHIPKIISFQYNSAQYGSVANNLNW